MPTLLRRRGLPQIGELRDWLDVLQPTSTTDPIGGQIPGDPVVAAHVPARVEPLDGEERFQGEQVTAGLQWRIVCRYLAGLSTAASIRVTFNFSGEIRTLQILSVRPIHPRWTEIVAAESTS